MQQQGLNPTIGMSLSLPVQLSSYAAAVDYSAAEAASITNRLDLITKLCRRFRCSRGASGLLALQEQWSEQLEQYYASEGGWLAGAVRTHSPGTGTADV
jgi:hypothetical protein